MTKRDESPVVVVGGGLAGLAAATLLARGGRAVTVLEQASDLGGRARTHLRSGFRFNLGPHALYRAGAGRRLLDEMGVTFQGNPPPSQGLWGLLGDKRHPLPTGLWSTLRTPLLSGGRWELMRTLSALPKVDAAAWQGRSVGGWLGTLRRPRARRMMEALVRLTTYCHAPDLLDAGAAIRQLKLALRASVLYLDGGWQSLVDGLYRAATEAGVRFETGRGVRTVLAGDSVEGVVLADGERRDASAVVLAVPPSVVRRLLGGRLPQLDGLLSRSVEVHAACLDVGLDRLPNPRVLFGLGLDQPHYLSVHSAVADLAPEGGAVVHVMRYLGAGEELSREAAVSDLEGLLDRLQPGWREHCVEKRTMPRMLVSGALPRFHESRPGPVVEELPGLFLAGDWVGSKGFLADAALGSAREAAERLLAGSMEGLRLAA